MWQALQMALEMGWMIVIPLILFALAGRYADRVFGTSPWLFLAGVGIAIMSTTVLLVKKFSRIMRDINKSSIPPVAQK